MTIRPPIAKQKRYPVLVLTVLHAREPEEPIGRPRIDWKLITDLPVDSHANAVEKLQWYAMRWKIEVFHNILKSRCRAEQARLRTAERLVRLLAVFCILSWRVFWLTMLNRAKPDLEPALGLTKLETNILDRLIPDPTADPSPGRCVGCADQGLPCPLEAAGFDQGAEGQNSLSADDPPAHAGALHALCHQGLVGSLDHA